MPRRYQHGTLFEETTAHGLCWYIRFTTPDGRRPRFRLGLKKDIPSRAQATRLAQPIRDQFNAGPEHLFAPSHTFGDVVARYEQEEMPERFSTRRGYTKMHRLYIVPQWGTAPIEQVEAYEVRAWLRSLTHLSPRSRGHLHGQMKNLFKHALLWRWLPPQPNPMSLFSLPGATKRTKKPRVIAPAQFRALLDYFAHAGLGGEEKSDREIFSLRMQTLLVAGYCLGLRASEIFALQWRDFDHVDAIVRISRAIVQQHVGNVKTERSDAPLPLARFVADLFLRWRQASPHQEDEDWVFASPYRGGRKPMDPNNLQTKYLAEAGRAIGLDFQLGWHTLRHSYKSLLDRVSSDASLKRDLMRHADVHTTLQVYGEVEMDRMRAANALAVDLATTE